MPSTEENGRRKANGEKERRLPEEERSRVARLLPFSLARDPRGDVSALKNYLGESARPKHSHSLRRPIHNHVRHMESFRC